MHSNFSSVRSPQEVCDKFMLLFQSFPFRYPYDEAATIAISTVKHFANDFKEVFHVCFLPP